jgi:1-acyl-sn-glycerol-3-phosphate acyltransferase
MMRSLKSPIRHLMRTLRNWKQRVKDYSTRCLQSGFIPFTYGPAQFFGRYIAKLIVLVQIGKLRVLGEENLQIPGRFLFCPNHSSMFDAPVMYSILTRGNVRYMTAYEEMRGFWGLKAIVMGAMGTFAVDRSKGKSVIEPAVEVLVSGQSLTIFPEGRVSETEACQPFKKGAAVIGSVALKRIPAGERIAIVPVNIKYHHRHDPTARTDFFKMGLKWRGGVTVTVGKPLYLDEMEGMAPDEIMAEARKFICNVQQGCACAA